MDELRPSALTNRPSSRLSLAGFCAFLMRPMRWSTVTTMASGALEFIGRNPRLLLQLLLALSLVQGVLGLWEVFGIATERIPPSHALTQLGAALYQPDHDIPIYALGIVACVLMDALLGLLLAKPREGGESFNPRITLLGCEIVVLLPALSPNSHFAHLPAAVLGLAWLAWQLNALRRDRFRLRAVPKPHAAPIEHTTSLPRALLVPMAIVMLFVFVPWPEALVWQSFAGDRFHHFDFYAMAPALAHAHGIRLGTEFYSQYGVGWPMVLHWLGATSGVAGYTRFVQLEVLVGCVYFLTLFLFLRTWLRDAGQATAGLLFALLLALFTDTGGYAKWLWPSSTVMRYTFDIAFFSVLLAHARSGAARLGPLAGTVLGLQLLFSSDVGLYLPIAFVVYLGCALRQGLQVRPTRAVLFFGFGATLGLIVVAGAGFTLANQGDFPNRIFWIGITESLFAYGGGIANLPIANVLAYAPGAGLLLLAMLTMYVRCLGSALCGFVSHRMSPDVPLRAAIAAYGLCTLMLFIGRSHEQNLMHVCIPFCLLAAHSASSMIRASTVRLLPPGMRLHGLLSIALVAVIWVQGYKVRYPNLADAALGSVSWVSPFSGAIDDTLPTAAPDVTIEFNAASEAIRKASDGGRHSVAVIGYNDTTYLVQAGVAPYFRYSPVLANLLFHEQITEITSRIDKTPPDWIFMAVEQEHTLYSASSADSVRPILSSMEHHYVHQGSAGHFQVFRKVDTTAQ